MAPPAQAPAAPAPGGESSPVTVSPADPVVVPELSPLARQAELNSVAREAFVNDVSQRIQAARELSNAGNPEAALNGLRNVLLIVQSGTALPEDSRRRLENQVRNAIGATERLEERSNLERAEGYRLFASQAARTAAVDRLVRDQETTNTLMTEFDSLMLEGNFRTLASGGLGDIDTVPPAVSSTPASGPRRPEPCPPGALALTRGCSWPTRPASSNMTHEYDLLKEYRVMLTMGRRRPRRRCRSPTLASSSTPNAPPGRPCRSGGSSALRRRRIPLRPRREDQGHPDEAERPDLDELPQRHPARPTSRRYIEHATQDEAAGLPTGIPIYVDPQGLQDADKTMASTVAINLEGMPLRTTLRLLLRQLNLTYTVKDGLLTITSSSSDDQPTEIRVYQVADLAIIPLSLLGAGGGGGGMGGGMGGGGMGGGMGGGGWAVAWAAVWAVAAWAVWAA